jgi:diguanylate cyclase (GGDEF)-like protein
LAGTRSSLPHRRAALGLAAFFVLSAALARPLAALGLPAFAPFAAIVATASCCVLIITAYLTLGQAAVTRSRPLVVLAGAYVFVALLSIPNVFVAPDIVAPLASGGTPAAAALLQYFSLAGFAALIVAFVRVQRGLLRPWSRSESRRMTAAVFGAALLCTLVALVAPPPAPAAWLVLVLAACGALAYLAATTGGRTILQLWLTVVLTGVTAAAVFTAIDAPRFSLAWYLGRCDGALASIVLLGVLIGDLTSASRRLAILASLDVLSGLGNRRALDERLEAHLSGRRRRGDALSLIMIDIDHFKAFNDRYGHATGDECLRAVAHVIRRSLTRATDFAARYGGEEFVVLLPATGRDGARIVAERIRRGVAALPVVAATASVHVTVSLGLITVPPRKAIDPAAVLAAADRALYAAKAAGRNCIFEVTRGFVDASGAATA